MTIPGRFALSLEAIQLDPSMIPPLLCPGIAGYASLKLAEVQSGEALGLYGFGPTAYYVLKVAQSLGVRTYVSTRSPTNIERARNEGADWAADASEEDMPDELDAAILFPPAGGLVEPILSQVKPGGCLVMAPVSSSSIGIENYSANLWGRDIKTLYHLRRSDAEEFLGVVDRLQLREGVSLYDFEELDKALIHTKQGKLDEPNAVIAIRP